MWQLVQVHEEFFMLPENSEVCVEVKTFSNSAPFDIDEDPISSICHRLVLHHH